MALVPELTSAIAATSLKSPLFNFIVTSLLSPTMLAFVIGVHER